MQIGDSVSSSKAVSQHCLACSCCFGIPLVITGYKLQLHPTEPIHLSQLLRVIYGDARIVKPAKHAFVSF